MHARPSSVVSSQRTKGACRLFSHFSVRAPSLGRWRGRRAQNQWQSPAFRRDYPACRSRPFNTGARFEFALRGNFRFTQRRAPGLRPCRTKLSRASRVCLRPGQRHSSALLVLNDDAIVSLASRILRIRGDPATAPLRFDLQRASLSKRRRPNRNHSFRFRRETAPAGRSIEFPRRLGRRRRARRNGTPVDDRARLFTALRSTSIRRLLLQFPDALLQALPPSRRSSPAHPLFLGLPAGMAFSGAFPGAAAFSDARGGFHGVLSGAAAFCGVPGFSTRSQMRQVLSVSLPFSKSTKVQPRLMSETYPAARLYQGAGHLAGRRCRVACSHRFSEIESVPALMVHARPLSVPREDQAGRSRSRGPGRRHRTLGPLFRR